MKQQQKWNDLKEQAYHLLDWTLYLLSTYSLVLHDSTSFQGFSPDIHGAITDGIHLLSQGLLS